jgi:hypothetical protein
MTEAASYLTPEGANRLRKELEQLKGQGREDLARRLRSAIQQGDLSENADYISAKEEQGFLEGRIQELERILANVIIIDEHGRCRRACHHPGRRFHPGDLSRCWSTRSKSAAG